METITREDLGDDAEGFIARVEAGESFVIEHDGIAVAELRPHGGSVSGP